MMFNQMKYEMATPECLRTAHVTILHKKNCRTDLNYWRGIFVCSVLRNILMKLIYGRTYEKVDASMTDSQIGARKKKSVRNHLFVVNSIISDVMSSVKKKPIDLNVMDFKQMFDAEELSVCLVAMYDANIRDDMLALIYEANKMTKFAVKTPNGIKRSANIVNKVLQGDVLAPLISSNMVDKNIGGPAIVTNNVYLYKNKIVIPPLTMQDDTLGISECGYKSRKMNNFLNIRTQFMGLQFGSEKCEKLHIGKRPSNPNICTDLEVDIWEDQLSQELNGNSILVDVHIGKEIMKNVSSKKYLGQIIQSDGKNELNIKSHTDKAFGNANKIINALIERPYGKHAIKAALLMREALLVSSLLSNAETWTNLTETSITKLTMPDTKLHRDMLSTSGNPSRVFMCLELGIIPVRYVIMKKRLNFLHYILKETITSTVRQVYDTLKHDSRKGDFYFIIQKDLRDCDLT